MNVINKNTLSSNNCLNSKNSKIISNEDKHKSIDNNNCKINCSNTDINVTEKNKRGLQETDFETIYLNQSNKKRKTPKKNDYAFDEFSIKSFDNTKTTSDEKHINSVFDDITNNIDKKINSTTHNNSYNKNNNNESYGIAKNDHKSEIKTSSIKIENTYDNVKNNNLDEKKQDDNSDDKSDNNYNNNEDEDEDEDDNSNKSKDEKNNNNFNDNINNNSENNDTEIISGENIIKNINDANDSNNKKSNHINSNKINHNKNKKDLNEIIDENLLEKDKTISNENSNESTTNTNVFPDTELIISSNYTLPSPKSVLRATETKYLNENIDSNNSIRHLSQTTNESSSTIDNIDSSQDSILSSSNLFNDINFLNSNNLHLSSLNSPSNQKNNLFIKGWFIVIFIF